MTFGSISITRALKPILAGMALAYLITAFLDKPASVHFQPENPYAAKQAEIVEPQAELVIEKNIMKLGSLLSVTADDVVTGEGLPSFSSPVISDEVEILLDPSGLPAVKGEASPSPEF